MNRQYAIKLSESNFLNWQFTPWDKKAFGINTAEITDFAFSADNKASQCLEKFETDSDAQLLYGRIKASDQIGKLAMLRNGFSFCEASVTVTLNRLQKYQLPVIYQGRLLALDLLKDEDIKDLKCAVRGSFGFSRFHENPQLERSCCDNRISLWVEDLWQNNVKCYVYRNSAGKVLSFMFYEIDNVGLVKLILGGSLLGYGMYSPFFWASVLNQLQNRGVIKVSSNISLANSGVMSLYQNFGFKFAQVMFDYQKLKV